MRSGRRAAPRRRRRSPPACCSPSRRPTCTSTTASTPMAHGAGQLDRQLLEQLVGTGKPGPSARPAGGAPGGAPPARPRPAAALGNGDGRMAAPPRRPDRQPNWKDRWQVSRGARSATAGRVRLELPGVAATGALDQRGRRAVYRAGIRPDRRRASDRSRRQRRTAILARFLANACPGRSGRRARPAIRSSADWARQAAGGMVAFAAAWCVVQHGEGEPMQWSAPENLEQVQRGSLAAAAPRGGDLLAAAVRRLPAALAARSSARRAAASSTGLAECWIACRACRCRRSCGSRRCCRCACPGISRAGSTSGRPAAWRVGLPRRRGQRGRTARILQRDTLRQLAARLPADAAALDEAAAQVLENLRKPRARCS